MHVGPSLHAVFTQMLVERLARVRYTWPVPGAGRTRRVRHRATRGDPGSNPYHQFSLHYVTHRPRFS